ncbi:hypothetical protein AgCh_031859 [Apium graveolens]
MLPTDPAKRLSFKRSVSDGDLVIVYERHDNMKAIKVCESTQIGSGNPLVPRFLATTVVPGCLVLELGTGSGSLTNSLARAVAPSGHVYTFDFHEQRATSAREDFERTRLSSLVTVGVRDIRGEVFPNEFTGKADSIFLDLPQPWVAEWFSYFKVWTREFSEAIGYHEGKCQMGLKAMVSHQGSSAGSSRR